MTKKIAVYFAPVDGWLQYTEVGEDYMEVLQLNIGDRLVGEECAFMVDPNQIVVIEDTLEEAVHTAIVITLDRYRSQYENGVQEGFEEFTKVDYATWLTPMLLTMSELASKPEHVERLCNKN